MAASFNLHADLGGRVHAEVLGGVHCDTIQVEAWDSNGTEVCIFASREQCAEWVALFKANNCLPVPEEVPDAHAEATARETDGEPAPRALPSDELRDAALCLALTISHPPSQSGAQAIADRFTEALYVFRGESND